MPRKKRQAQPALPPSGVAGSVASFSERSEIRSIVRHMRWDDHTGRFAHQSHSIQQALRWLGEACGLIAMSRESSKRYSDWSEDTLDLLQLPTNPCIKIEEIEYLDLYTEPRSRRKWDGYGGSFKVRTTDECVPYPSQVVLSGDSRTFECDEERHPVSSWCVYWDAVEKVLYFPRPLSETLFTRIPTRGDAYDALFALVEQGKKSFLPEEALKALYKEKAVLPPKPNEGEEDDELLLSDEQESDAEPEERQEAQEERKKDTEDVAESSSETSNDVHGGDGNSGEVEDSVAKSDAQDPSERESQQESDDGEEGEGGSAPSSKSALSRQTKEAEEELDRLLTEKPPVQEEERTRRGDPENTGFGGSNLDVLKIPDLFGEQRRHVKAICEEVVRIFAALATDPDSTVPPWNPAKLVREMVSKRWNLASAHKRQSETPDKLFVVGVDVSGSCSAGCMGFGSLAKYICDALQAKQVDCKVMLHSNGMPYQHYFPTEKKWLACKGVFGDWFLNKNKTTVPMSGGLFFGDLDGLKTYVEVEAQSGHRVIHMNDFDKKGGLKPWSAKTLADVPELKPHAAWQGVSGMESVLKALRTIPPVKKA